MISSFKICLIYLWKYYEQKIDNSSVSESHSFEFCILAIFSLKNKGIRLNQYNLGVVVKRAAEVDCITKMATFLIKEQL